MKPRALRPLPAPEAGIDVGPLADTVGYALRRAQLASFNSFRQVFASVGITPAQYSVLLVVERNPGLRQNQVSDALDIKRANLVGLIGTLEKRGFITRRQTTDRRSYALHLTGDGRKFLKPLQMLNASLEARLCAALSKDQREIFMTALKMIAAVGADIPGDDSFEEDA